MALSLLSRTAKRRDQVVVVDLGTRATKAVFLQRKGAGFSLTDFVVQDAPVYERGLSADLLGPHLKSVMQSLRTRQKQVTLVLGVADCMVRQVEMPLVPVSDMRTMLQLNSKNYLQQDLKEHAFDCFILPPKDEPEKDGGNGPTRGALKARVIVAGAKRALIDELQKAAKHAGLVAEQLVPAMVGPVNAFELAQPEVFAGEVVAVVDLGFKQTTISVLLNGEMTLNRVVGIGGDKLTSGLAETIGTSYEEAEGIKIGMASEVQDTLHPLLMPLGRELRASIDFFENQHDKVVSQVFMSGGAGQSEMIVQTLQQELMVPCHGWDPIQSVHPALSGDKAGEIDQLGPQLTVAIGAASTVF